MKQRCYNPNDADSYIYYGARGIKVCDEWKDDFSAFESWAMSHGYRDDLTIDRIDVDADYCPENCRWATPKEQSNNTRRNRYITYNGETKTLTEWAELTGIDYQVLAHRFNKNWSAEDAFSVEAKPHERFITFNGKTMNLRQWAKETGIGRCTISGRIARGWSIERALTSPIPDRYKRKDNR